MNDIDKNEALYAFRKFGDTVLRAAFACCGNYSEAEDITQEVFLSLHAKPQSFNNDDHMKAWLLRAAINRCKNYHKSFRRKNQRSLDEVSELEMSYEFTPQDMTIRGKIAALPEKYASVLYLYYYEEYNIREIAELLNKNENTVSSLLRRARQKIKVVLEEDENYETERI